MANPLSGLLNRICPNSVFGFDGRRVELESPYRLSFKDGLRVHWLTVQTDGTLDGGVAIDIATMNASNPAQVAEPREARIDLACRVCRFLIAKGYECAVLEDGNSIQTDSNGSFA